MDAVLPECKKKMARFRLQELKDVLGQLGLPRYGRKQDLYDRILALLSEGEASDINGSQRNKSIRKDDVVKIINDTYRKMPFAGGNDPVTGGHSACDSSSITAKEEIMDEKVRCPCGGTVQTEFMIQCADPQCHILQHISCVVIPVDPTEGVQPAASQHYCELCRINRSDPFWKTLGSPLLPIKLLITNIPDDGSPPQQSIETTFQITRANVHLLENVGIDVQVWCILLNDCVPFRLQWPQYADLKVNGIPVKTINRPGSKRLGANGRDDAPSISVFLVEGINKIALSCTDERTFCLGVRLVSQRTDQQVISMIPKEEEGESFSEAVARVCRCIGGGTSAANDDSDSDLEVIADNVTINLRCPMSGCRMKTAARFKGCIHLGCFDLHTLIQINQRSRKWQCPICLKNYSLEDIIIDPYLNRIVKMMQPCDEDVTEVDVKSDGSWRVKISRPFMDLERWHLPEGSLCNSDDSNMEDSGVKSEHQLSTRSNGHRVSGVGLPQVEEYSIISMSSGSSEDDDDDDIGRFETSAHKNNMMDYTPYNHNNQMSGITYRSSSSSLADANVIVLSDSDDEDNETVSATGGGFHSTAANPEITDMPLDNAVSPAAGSPHPSGNVKAETSQMPGSPFTFPRQPRTIRRPSATRGD